MAAKGGGVIVNTASNIAIVGIRDRAAYVATKGAVDALTRAMAIDHAGQGIRVNAVAPGPTATSYFEGMLARSNDPAAFTAALAARSPLNRVAQPEEIARAIVFLALGRQFLHAGRDAGGGWWPCDLVRAPDRGAPQAERVNRPPPTKPPDRVAPRARRVNRPPPASALFHAGNRALQDRFDGRRVADTLEARRRAAAFEPRMPR